MTLFRIVVWMLAVVGALVGTLWLFQRRLIYLPDGKVPPIGETLPGWEEVAFDTADGLTLSGWFTPPHADAPVLIVFNGNGGNRAGRAELGARLATAGFGVLLFDYRGYGGNPGRPTEDGLAADARAALHHMRETAPGHPLVYYGESLGAAVAIELATAHPPAGLVLRSPFTSLADVAAVHYPWLPVRLMLWDDLASDERIGSVAAPVLVIAGTADSIVPTTQSLTIHELAPVPKDLLVIEGADHNDASLNSGAELIRTVAGFVRGL